MRSSFPIWCGEFAAQRCGVSRHHHQRRVVRGFVRTGPAFFHGGVPLGGKSPGVRPLRKHRHFRVHRSVWTHHRGVSHLYADRPCRPRFRLASRRPFTAGTEMSLPTAVCIISRCCACTAFLAPKGLNPTLSRPLPSNTERTLLMLDEIRVRVRGVDDQVAELTGASLTSSRMTAELQELEAKMGQPDFWNDARAAAGVGRRKATIGARAPAVARHRSEAGRPGRRCSSWRRKAATPGSRQELTSELDQFEPRSGRPPGRAAPLRRARPEQCHCRDSSRSGRNRIPGLGADAAAHVRPMGGEQKVQGGNAGSSSGR